MHATAADVLLLAAATLGVLDALYFLLVIYRVLPPDTRLVPGFCRMDTGTCGRIIDHPSARLFRLPNATYGLAWYVVVAAFALVDLVGVAIPAGGCWALLGASALTVAVSSYLAYVLLGRLHTFCRLCFLGHAMNVAILGGLAWLCLA